MDTQTCLKQAKESMNATVAHFDKDLQKVRAGKASPQMLDGIKVDYYGNPTPIEQVANVNTPDAHQIVIQPWERNMLPVIEKAILAANIGVTPQNNGEFIRLVIPAPTEERRKELVKKAKQDADFIIFLLNDHSLSTATISSPHISPVSSKPKEA